MMSIALSEVDTISNTCSILQLPNFNVHYYYVQDSVNECAKNYMYVLVCMVVEVTNNGSPQRKRFGAISGRSELLMPSLYATKKVPQMKNVLDFDVSCSEMSLHGTKTS